MNGFLKRFAEVGGKRNACQFPHCSLYRPVQVLALNSFYVEYSILNHFILIFISSFILIPHLYSEQVTDLQGGRILLAQHVSMLFHLSQNLYWYIDQHKSNLDTEASTSVLAHAKSINLETTKRAYWEEVDTFKTAWEE